jgi:hypothetical protein
MSSAAVLGRLSLFTNVALGASGLSRERLVDVHGPEFEDAFWEREPT